LKAIVLAAGRGERLRPLTDQVPKPLLKAGRLTLIEWQIERLVGAGINDIIVNVSHLGEKIEQALGDGRQLGARVRYSREAVALETAGGIAQASTLLGDAPFIAVNADIYCDYAFSRLIELTREPPQWLAYLVLVDNPAHHPRGDFGLQDDMVCADGSIRYTFSGIGVYQPRLFATINPGERRALGPLLREHIARGEVHGEHFAGLWMDIGTAQRLAELRALLASGHETARR
jgi:MurNAc alpha-1-phosphate uridylyltransferase